MKLPPVATSSNDLLQRQCHFSLACCSYGLSPCAHKDSVGEGSDDASTAARDALAFTLEDGARDALLCLKLAQTEPKAPARSAVARAFAAKRDSDHTLPGAALTAYRPCALMP
jgi:hypothetical protein